MSRRDKHFNQSVFVSGLTNTVNLWYAVLQDREAWKVIGGVSNHLSYEEAWLRREQASLIFEQAPVYPGVAES